LTSIKADITGVSNEKKDIAVPTTAEIVTDPVVEPRVVAVVSMHLSCVNVVHESVVHTLAPAEADMVLSSVAKFSPSNVTEAPPLAGPLSNAALLTIGASNVKRAVPVPTRDLTNNVVYMSV
jgi:hypothetical protein